VREHQVATNLSILGSSRPAAAAARLCLWRSRLARKHGQPPRLPILLTLLHIPIGLILVKHAACARTPVAPDPQLARWKRHALVGVLVESIQLPSLQKRPHRNAMSCQRTTDCKGAKVGSPSMVLGAVAENVGNKSGRKGELGGGPYSSSFGCGQPEVLKERHLRGQTTPTWASPFCCCYSSQRSQRSRRGWWEWRDRGASAGREVGVACHRLWCRKPMDCVRL
jgi:hypothetical protein